MRLNPGQLPWTCCIVAWQVISTPFPFHGMHIKTKTQHSLQFKNFSKEVDFQQTRPQKQKKNSNILYIYNVYTYNFPSHFTFPSYFCSQQTPVSSQQGRSNRWSKNLPRPSLIQSLLTSLHDFPVQTRCFPREGGVFFGTISHYGSMERASIFTDPCIGMVMYG